MLFGTSKLITNFLNKGQPYAQIKKVYSINIVYFQLGQGANYFYHGKTQFVGLHHHNVLKLSPSQQVKWQKTSPCQLYPEYIIIKVNNFDDVASSTLDEWIYYLENNELPAQYKAKGLQQVAEQLKFDDMSPQ